MRLIIRVCLFVLLAFGAPSAFAEHFTADCPLSLVGSTPAISSFGDSPHGVFRNGNVVYLLRGQNLTTLTTTAVGELEVEREDNIDTMANRESDGGSVYHSGYLYVSGEAGLEVFDLRDVHEGGAAPVLLNRIPAATWNGATRNAHYRQMTASGNVLAATYPAKDLPCVANGDTCFNWIDIYSITDPAHPVLMHRLDSRSALFVGFNDVEFARGYLYATGMGGTVALDVTNPALPATAGAFGVRGDFLATNGSMLAIGQETLIGVFTIGPGANLNYFSVFHLPSIMDRANQIMFHPEAWLADTRLITMIDEKNPMTGKPARTIAFDVFDFTVPFYEGSDDRIYENVSFVETNERLFDPVAVGPYVYVVGEVSGTQKWGACGTMAGRIELDSVRSLSCGGGEIHGWVTGAQKIANVEVFLDGEFLGNATFGSVRNEVRSATPAVTWQIPVNLDATQRGTRTVRAIGTDVLGNRFQFASTNIFFPGPGQNCTTRRRSIGR